MKENSRNNGRYYDDLTYIATDVHESKSFDEYRYHNMSICRSVEGKDVVIAFQDNDEGAPDTFDMIYCINRLGFNKKQPIHHFVSKYNTYYFFQAIA